MARSCYGGLPLGAGPRHHCRGSESVYSGSMRTFVTALLASTLLLPFAYGAKKPSAKGDYFVYIGTYTRENSKGIYAYRFHPADGKLTSLGFAAETTNPSFMAIHPTGRFVYSV